MQHSRLLFFTIALAAVSAAAQPAVSTNGVVNAASYTPQTIPGTGIAQGSVFSIFGTGLGPATAVNVGAFPLPTTLGGSSVAVTVNGTTVNAILFFVRKDQINALLPSNTPVGSGTLAVTYNNQTSAPAPITVVARNVGIFTLASSGSGPGVITDGNGKPATYTFAANPGQILNIWATGLGAVSFPDNEPPQAGNISGVVPTVYIGGVQVKPSYYGRSGCCSGVDQIQVQIPSNITGCSVPLAVQAGTAVSNFVTIAIASSGHTCSDPATGLSGSQFSQYFSKGSGSFGVIGLDRIAVDEPALTIGGASTSVTSDTGVALFDRYSFSGQTITGLPFSVTSYGSCYVYFYQGSSATEPTGTFTSAGLDAGSAITVTGPNGAKSMTPIQTGVYNATLGSDAPTSTTGPLYLSAGSYTITGPGGKDVGPFSVSMTLPPALTWTNKDSISDIPRSNPLTLTWDGGDPNGYVQIVGSSIVGVDSATPSGGGFICNAKTSDKQFTIPSVVLLALPPSDVIQSGGFSFATGNLEVFGISQTVPFTAKGIDMGIATAATADGKTVTFQ